jgi:hypothetical protein
MNHLNIAATASSVAIGVIGLYLQVAHPTIANLAEADLLLGLADDGAPPMPLGPEAGRARHRPRDLCEDLDAKLAAALAFAKTKLAIAGDQEPEWQRFTAAITAGADPLQRECAASAGQSTPATLPQSLARLERRLGAALEVARAVRPAADTLYAHLTPAQQDSVDALAQRLP